MSRNFILNKSQAWIKLKQWPSLLVHQDLSSEWHQGKIEQPFIFIQYFGSLGFISLLMSGEEKVVVGKLKNKVQVPIYLLLDLGFLHLTSI